MELRRNQRIHLDERPRQDGCHALPAGLPFYSLAPGEGLAGKSLKLSCARPPADGRSGELLGSGSAPPRIVLEPSPIQARPDLDAFRGWRGARTGRGTNKGTVPNLLRLETCSSERGERDSNPRNLAGFAAFKAVHRDSSPVLKCVEQGL